MYTTQTTLLMKVSAGDKISWQEFYNSYRPLIISIAAAHHIPEADVDDIVQQTMLAMFNDGDFIYQREKHGGFRTFSGGIIRHKIYDYFRSQRKNSRETEDVDTTIKPDFEQLYLNEYRKFVLAAAIRELRGAVSPEYFETFQLCCLQRIANKKVAALLNEKANTISVRKKRCLELLRKIIEQINFHDPELDIKYL